MKRVQQRVGLAVCLITCLGLTACTSSLPPSTPQVLSLASQRLELNATLDSAAFRNVLDNATFAADDVKDAFDAIKGLDQSNLTADQQRAVANAVEHLESAEQGLAFDSKIVGRQSGMNARTKEIIAAITIVEAILAEKIDQEKMLASIASGLRESISGSQSEVESK